MRLCCLIVAILAQSAMMGVAAKAAPDYVPIPPGYDFPADQATLEHFRDTDNVPEMRRHAWYVFAGLTQRSADGTAVWETWHPQQLVFAPGEPQGGGGPRPIRPFELPIQKQAVGGHPEAVGDSALSFVMFNQESRDFIRSKNYHKASVLTQLNASWPAGTPLAQRSIDPFPRTAVGLKLVWQVVKAAPQRTVLGVWDGVPTRALTQSNPSSSWPRAVVVDPTRTDIPASETMVVNWRGNDIAAHVVSLDRFYHFEITSAEIAAAQSVLGGGVAVGDHAVLVAMHMTTKEIPDWVWATFWWHDHPADGQFGADRPAVVEGPWRNYRMDVAYSADTPVEFDGSPNASFNPYIEDFADGIPSNCMACHQQARYPSSDFDQTVRGMLDDNDSIFEQQVKSDFLWAIPFLAN